MQVTDDEYQHSVGSSVSVDVSKDYVTMDFASAKVNDGGYTWTRDGFSFSGKVTGRDESASNDECSVYYGVFDNSFAYSWQRHDNDTGETVSSTMRSNGLTSDFYIRSYTDGHCEVFVNIHGDITGYDNEQDALQRIAVADGGNYVASQDTGPFSEFGEIRID
jgi:hypothetical protein